MFTSLKDLFKKKEPKFEWYFALIYLLIFAIPLNHKEVFSVFDPDLIWAKYILVVLALTGIYFFVRNYRKYINDPFLLFLIGFVLFQVLSLLQSQDITSSLRFIGFQSAIAFAYIPVRNFIFQKRTGLRRLLLMYGLAFIPIFLFLLVQIYLQSNFGTAIGGVWPVPGYPTRYGATFWDINHFGAFAGALSLIFLGAVFSSGVSGKLKLFSGFILILTLISLYLTGSRSSSIGFIFGLLTFVIVYLKTTKFQTIKDLNFGVYFGGVLASVLAPLYLIYLAAEPIKESLLYRSVSFFAHLFLLKVGIILGIKNFLFGIGTNSFHAYFRQTEWANAYYYIDPAAVDLKLPLHNLWLEVLTETGIVSFALFTAFWVLLLMGLYRVYQSQKDSMVLGLLSGLVVFLIGGFMYSYKSEFFWFFVLIAAAYVSRNYFDSTDFDIKKRIKELLCVNDCDFLKIFLFVLSLVIVFIPVIFITHPLNLSEIRMFNGAYEPNFVINKYNELLMLFRYVIGNYTYTGRLLSAIFYFGSFALLFLVFSRYIPKFYSFIFAAAVFGIANILEPNLIVSIKFYLTFVILVVVSAFLFLTSFVRGDIKLTNLNKLNNFQGVLIVLLGLILTVGLIRNNSYFDNSYSEDLTFLMELTYNRSLMDNTLIQIGENIDVNLVYYFADDITRDKESKEFQLEEGTVLRLSRLDLDNYSKNLFIYMDSKDNQIGPFVEAAKNSLELETTMLEQGKFNVFFVERRTGSLADQSQ